MGESAVAGVEELGLLLADSVFACDVWRYRERANGDGDV